MTTETKKTACACNAGRGGCRCNPCNCKDCGCN
jgi:hypothetical protein